MVQRFVSLVTVCGTSLRCAASVITLYGPSARYDETACRLQAEWAPLWETSGYHLSGCGRIVRPLSGSRQFAGWTRDHFVTAGLIRGESTRCPGLGRCSVEHPRDLSMELLA